MEKENLRRLVVGVCEKIIEGCSTDEEVEQVKQAIVKYLDFIKSIS